MKRKMSYFLRYYLSAPVARQEEMVRYATLMEKLGLEVTSSWIYSPPLVPAWDELDCEARVRVGQDIAERDLMDIDDAANFLFFSDISPGLSNGRMVELGYAIARGKRVVVIGAIENVFLALRGLIRYPDPESFFEWLKADRRPAVRSRRTQEEVYGESSEVFNPRGDHRWTFGHDTIVDGRDWSD